MPLLLVGVVEEVFAALDAPLAVTAELLPPLALLVVGDDALDAEVLEEGFASAA